MTGLRYVIVSLFLLFALNKATADPIKQALKALEEGDFSKTQDFISKLIDKDSLNPTPYYLSALLFKVDSFPDFNLQFSFKEINRAIRLHGSLSEKDLEKLKRSSIDYNVLSDLKYSIQEQAFEIIRPLGDKKQYEEFARFYSDSLLTQYALELRDSVAYLDARKINTWQSYKRFLDNYPNAKDSKDARKSYDWLLFKEKTAGEVLENLELFYREHKDSPYLDKVIASIYKQRVAMNTVSEHNSFIKDYPESKWSKQSQNVLFHLVSDRSAYQWQDSLQQIIKLNQGNLIPTFSNGKYGFMKVSGEEVLRSSLDELPAESFCYGEQGDLILVKEGDEQILISRDGSEIISSFFQYKDLGFGYLSVEGENGVGVVHKSGMPVLDAKYDNVKLLKHHYLGVEKEGIWGVTTMFGEWVYQPQFDDIESVNNILLFYKNDGVFPELIDDLKSRDQKTQFIYEEVEQINDQFYIGIKGDQESLLSKDLKVLIPLGDHTIYEFNERWCVKSAIGFQFFDDKESKLLDEVFQDIQSNEHWLGLKKDSKWTLIHKQDQLEPRFKLDSIKLISEQLVYLKDDLFQRVIFGSSMEVSVGREEMISPVRSAIDANTSGFMVIDNGKKKSLYNPQGEKLFASEFDEILFLNDSVFIVNDDGKKGIVSSTGEVLIRSKYDAIMYDANFSDWLHLLLGSEIGAYRISTNTLVDADFESKVLIANHNRLFVQQEGEYGLWDVPSDDYVDALRFQELIPFSGDYYLAKVEDSWELRSVLENEILMEGIYSFEKLLESEDFEVLKFRVTNGVGLFDSRHGILLKPEYNEIVKLPFENENVYYAERFFEDAELYITLYIDEKGNKILSQAFDEIRYDKISCDL